MRRGSLVGIISGAILIFIGVVNLIFFYGTKIDFWNWFKPGSPIYVAIIFFVAIFLVWESPVKRESGKIVRVSRGKLIGVLILIILFSEYYIKAVPQEDLFKDLFSLIGIGSLGHGIIMILLGIFAIFDPSHKRGY